MPYWDRNDAESKLVGMKVVSVNGDTFKTEDGCEYRINLDGDCCSSSYFSPEGEEAIRDLAGKTIRSVEHRDGPSSNNPDKKYEDNDCTIWSFLFFETDQGSITIDWRNDSNGYYSGQCCIAEVK